MIAGHGVDGQSALRGGWWGREELAQRDDRGGAGRIHAQRHRLVDEVRLQQVIEPLVQRCRRRRDTSRARHLPVSRVVEGVDHRVLLRHVGRLELDGQRQEAPLVVLPEHAGGRGQAHRGACPASPPSSPRSARWSAGGWSSPSRRSAPWRRGLPRRAWGVGAGSPAAPTPRATCPGRRGRGGSGRASDSPPPRRCRPNSTSRRQWPRLRVSPPRDA